MKLIPYTPGKPRKIPKGTPFAVYGCKLEKPNRTVRVAIIGKGDEPSEVGLEFRMETKKGETQLKFSLTYDAFCAMWQCANEAAAEWHRQVVLSKVNEKKET
jgi:hypothetical protein